MDTRQVNRQLGTGDPGLPPSLTPCDNDKQHNNSENPTNMTKAGGHWWPCQDGDIDHW